MTVIFLVLSVGLILTLVGAMLILRRLEGSIQVLRVEASRLASRADRNGRSGH